MMKIDQAKQLDGFCTLRMLLIEDDEIDIRAFRRAFHKAEPSCEMQVCRRAEEAVDLLEREPETFHLVVTDHQLPGMSGLDLCKELLEQDPPFALVLLTGAGSEGVALEALEAGVDDYIVKDFRPQALDLLAVKLPQVARRHQDRLARRRAEKELRISREAALEASQVKSQFLANMSHEIRTPLNGIVGMTELVLTTELTAQQREYLEAIRTSAGDLAGVVGDILEAARIVAQRVELVEIPFRLADLVAETVGGAQPRARRKGLDLRVEIDAEVPEMVVGDPSRIQQVLKKLIDNAIKFTDYGWIEVQVGRGAASDPSVAVQGIEIRVTDTGIGIPADHLGEIFKPFTQVDASDTRRYGGTGLGLCICSHLARLMQGGLWVESRAGAGASFHFTAHLPAVPCRSLEEIGQAETVDGSRSLIGLFSS